MGCGTVFICNLGHVALSQFRPAACGWHDLRIWRRLSNSERTGRSVMGTRRELTKRSGSPSKSTSCILLGLRSTSLGHMSRGQTAERSSGGSRRSSAGAVAVLWASTLLVRVNEAVPPIRHRTRLHPGLLIADQNI